MILLTPTEFLFEGCISLLLLAAFLLGMMVQKNIFQTKDEVTRIIEWWKRRKREENRDKEGS